jgi:hypothetical protein
MAYRPRHVGDPKHFRYWGRRRHDAALVAMPEVREMAKMPMERKRELGVQRITGIMVWDDRTPRGEDRRELHRCRPGLMIDFQ